MRSLSHNRSLDDDDSSQSPVSFLDLVYRYNFIMVVSITTTLLVYKAVKYFKRHQMNGFRWHVMKAEYMSLVNRSIAVYISRNKVIQAIFYAYGLWIIIISYPFVYFTLYYLNPGPSTSYFVFTLELTVFMTVQTSTLMSFFLYTMIGAKNQILDQLSNPLDSAIMTHDQRIHFVQLNFKIAIILTLFLKFAILIEININISLIQYLVIIYYVTNRLSFLYFEKKAIMYRAIAVKMKHRASTIKKSVTENNPKIFIQAILQEQEEVAPTREHMLDVVKDIIEERINTLEQTLQTIQEDNSTPMLEVTGEISILPKILLWNTLITIFIAIIEYFRQRFNWSDNNYWTNLLNLFFCYHTNAIICIAIFCSHVLFGFKDNEKEQYNIELERVGWNQSFEHKRRIFCLNIYYYLLIYFSNEFIFYLEYLIFFDFQ